MLFQPRRFFPFAASSVSTLFSETRLLRKLKQTPKGCNILAKCSKSSYVDKAWPHTRLELFFYNFYNFHISIILFHIIVSIQSNPLFLKQLQKANFL